MLLVQGRRQVVRRARDCRQNDCPSVPRSTSESRYLFSCREGINSPTRPATQIGLIVRCNSATPRATNVDPTSLRRCRHKGFAHVPEMSRSLPPSAECGLRLSIYTHAGVQIQTSALCDPTKNSTHSPQIRTHSHRYAHACGRCVMSCAQSGYLCFAFRFLLTGQASGPSSIRAAHRPARESTGIRVRVADSRQSPTPNTSPDRMRRSIRRLMKRAVQ